MKYTEEELTEATKLVVYLRSIQKYAVAIALLSIFYFGFRFYSHSENRTIYLLAIFTGIMIVGSLSIIIRMNRKTSIIYGFSCMLAGGVFLYSLVYYRIETSDFITTVGFIIGLLVIRHGIHLVFGRYSQEIFSRSNQRKISFVRNVIASMKHSFPTDENIVHCTYTNDGKTRNLKIKFLDDIACFLLAGQPTPLFFDRQNISLFELRNNGDFLRVSVVADSHDWLEADLKAEDFKKYQRWKDL